MPKLSRKRSESSVKENSVKVRKQPKKKSTKRKMKPVNVKKLEGTEFYCVKCKKICAGKNVKQSTMKNGRGALKGVCKECDTKMFRIM